MKRHFQNRKSIFAITLLMASCNSSTQTESTKKIQGNLSGNIIYVYSEGKVFENQTDRPDSQNVFRKEVFRYSGCGLEIKRLLGNGNVATKSKGWLLHRDPKTNKFLGEVKNQYTTEVVKIQPSLASVREVIMTPQGSEVDASFTVKSTAIGSPLYLVFTERGDKIHFIRYAFAKWFEKKSQTSLTKMTLNTSNIDKEHLYDRSLTRIPPEYQCPWVNSLYAGGAYAYWQAGQIMDFASSRANPIYRIHFAKEHTTLINRGIEGGMESLERAAFELMTLLG